MATIGEQLREARKRKGFTQEALASALHMSRQGISHWEQGRTIPDAEMLLKLSTVLEYNFEDQRPVMPEAAEATDAAQPQPAAPAAAQDPEPAPELADPIQAVKPSIEPAQAPEKARPRRMKPWAAIIAALLAIGLLALLLPVLFPKTPEVSLSFAEGEIHLDYIPSNFDDKGYGWLFTLAIHNESDVPLKPEKVSTLYYTDERINSKSIMLYEDMRPWMESDLLNKLDSPLHLYFGTNDTTSTRVECILHATDPSGKTHTYTITAPLLPMAY